MLFSGFLQKRLTGMGPDEIGEILASLGIDLKIHQASQKRLMDAIPLMIRNAALPGSRAFTVHLKMQNGDTVEGLAIACESSVTAVTEKSHPIS
jgi:hypothetical protein